MSDYFAVLQQDLVDAARRRSKVRPLRRRPPTRSFLLAAALALLVAGSAMAGTLYVLRGSPVPAPEPRDAGAAQTVEPGSSKVLPQRVDDPAGGPPFALRLSRSRTGFVCSTIGQVDGEDFGLVGLDGRFRPFAEGVVDSCGQRRDNATTLIGARVLDARAPDDIRTVVSGVAGAQLREADIQMGGDQRRLEPGPEGTFITVVPGYPEDLGIRVVLRFTDGHEEDFPFGRSDFVVVDPLGGPAWQMNSFSFSEDSRRCVSFQTARERVDGPVSPSACGQLAGKPNRERGYFFAVRRLRERPGNEGRFNDGRGRWRGPPRTAVWGLTGKDVRRIVVVGPDGRREVARAPSGTFLTVYGPDTEPRDLRVEVTLRNRSTRTYRRDTNLLRPRNAPMGSAP